MDSSSLQSIMMGSKQPPSRVLDKFCNVVMRKKLDALYSFGYEGQELEQFLKGQFAV